ncbi:TetR/AcrR family transcriptional regulator [Maritimibacter sp. UBA3975]|uniref:TetR/AcrR family transcriptional regulator n=1 Tax=Maritimibacter sp. UBA3975 TaxID=1946833 RepID=UPI000C090A67|nr:TetR/AcrR family transcriptional regulator [Maritimibacter sp. UBA3975]MAM61675.1 TetR family transcriptional regulator [Maritimibacter sp.]|tara:strand:- start:4890 stop:5492 length:603 start_codon:yes stop_codon:yes gene_type:complete
MQVDTVRPERADEKQVAILDAAFDAFRAYGFRRVSMADIARGAGMSRAAVYLHFKNKEAIFNALVQSYFDQVATQMAGVLAAAPDPVAGLRAALALKVAKPFDALMASPHGAELMDAKSTVAAEMAAAGDARLTGVLADWLESAARDGRVTLEAFGTAGETASVIYEAVHGVVMAARDYDRLLTDLDRLARLFGRALTPA